MADNIAQQFVGLPIEDLIVSPIVGMAKGQAKLNEVTWKYISEVAFVTGKDAVTALFIPSNSRSATFVYAFPSFETERAKKSLILPLSTSGRSQQKGK